MGTAYDDEQTHQDIRNSTAVIAGASTFMGPVAAKLAAAWGVGANAGNELGHYLDGANGCGVDPETGKELDVFDVAAKQGMNAENWVQNKLGAQEGDGSWKDKLGGVVGGATAGGLGALLGIGKAEVDVKDAAVNLFGGMFD